jgi:RNA polymerase sigma-70 factor (ECF subfamily)
LSEMDDGLAEEMGETDEHQTDEQLMAAFARGAGGESEAAFQALFRRYRQAVYGFFRRRVGDAALAEELAQETFLAVLKARGRYQASALFRTYLYGIAFRILKAHRRKAVFRAMFAGKSADHESDVAAGLDAGLVLRQAVGRLERMDREIVLLREYEDLSYTEIAAVLEIPVNTVRSRLFRARMALRHLLTEPAPIVDAKGMRRAEGQA